MAPPTRIAPLERSVLSDHVSQIIMDGLLNGNFQPGDVLVESELAELLGVSRSPIREALQDLQNSGVVTKSPGRRAMIRSWTAKDLEELFSVRALLEGHAARLVAARKGDADPKDLHCIVAEMNEAAGVEDYARLVQLDLEFHEELWRLADNDILRTVLDGLKQQFRLFHTMNWKFHGGANCVSKNHQILIDAVTGDDPDAAEKAMRAHVVVEKMMPDQQKLMDPNNHISKPEF